MPDFSVLISQLDENKIPYLQNEPLSMHTSFKIGGNAAVFACPQNNKQLALLILLCNDSKVKYFILGKGSNVLFCDSGYAGVIISIGEAFNKITVNGSTITAQAGASLSEVCIKAREASLTGLEFAFGIPGCVGGAVFMNAGAYDGEMKDVVKSVECLNKKGEILSITRAQAKFEYRSSIFQKEDLCILSTEFSLQHGEKAIIAQKMADLAERRKDKQPLDLPSAGSAFKRPEGAFAGALIDQCGLRGKSVGGASISDKHCGFIVNNGGATCENVLSLADEVCKTVYEQTGYNLEKEIRVIE